jgi:uncharacterized protein YbjT (DUF2867 family)
VSSRNPKNVHASLSKQAVDVIPVAVDITKPATLAPAFEDANVVISLVGIMHGMFKDLYLLKLNLISL